MRQKSWQGLLALAISVVGHVLLVTAVLHICQITRYSPAAADRPVDLSVVKPNDYPALSLRLVDPPPRPSQAKAAPVPDVAKPVVESTKPGPRAEIPNASPKGNQPPGTGSAPAGPSPLHGKLTKAGLSIVYVLDCSGSMGRDRKLAHGVAVLKASLQQLGPDVRFQIVVYDSRASIFQIGRSMELVAASQANIVDAVGHLDDLTGEGSSRHAEGLRMGLGLHPDVLILVTDADELSTQDVKLIKKWNQKGTTIHAVLIGSPVGEDATALREVTGPGRVHFVSLPRPTFMP